MYRSRVRCSVRLRASSRRNATLPARSAPPEPRTTARSGDAPTPRATCDPSIPFAAHHADLDARASVKHRHERNEAIERKVDVPGRHGRLADDLAQNQATGSQIASRRRRSSRPRVSMRWFWVDEARPFRGAPSLPVVGRPRLSATVRSRSFATRPGRRCGSAQTPSCLNATTPRSSC